MEWKRLDAFALMARFWKSDENVTFVQSFCDGGVDRPSSDCVLQPKTWHLVSMFPVALFLFVAQNLLSRFVFVPLALFSGLKNEQRKPLVFNATLEKAFRLNKNVNAFMVEELAKKLEWSNKSVLRWFHARKQHSKATTLDQAVKSYWHLTVHLISFVYTAVQLFNHDIYCQYFCLFQLGYVTNGMFMLFYDAKHQSTSTFYMMIIHHVVVFLSCAISYIHQLCLLTVLGFCLHDFTDLFLQIFRLLKLMQQDKFMKIAFGCFGLSWIVARLILFPWLICCRCLLNMPSHLQIMPLLICFNTLVVLLFILNVIWGKEIATISFELFSTGYRKDIFQVALHEPDTESEEEEEEEEEEENGKQKQLKESKSNAIECNGNSVRKLKICG